MDQTEALLKEITEASGVPGYEEAVRAVMRKHLEGVAAIEQDRMGSFIASHKGTSAGPSIMLAGHMDEIGFMVRMITKEGFIKFVPLGGWWDMVLLGHRVSIKTAKGDVLGVLGAKPPHILSDEERKKMVDKKDMYIDVGARSEEEVREMGIRPGDPIIPISDFAVMGHPRVYLSKAFDNRIGCALAMQALQQVALEGHPNSVYAVGTVQEEVGLRGAKTSSFAINPDVGIVLEVDIAGDVPGIRPEESSIKMGGGPSLLLYDARMIPHLKLRDLVIATAEELEIPLQFSAMPGGATDGAMIQSNSVGVPTVVLAVPTRHIHSHNSILCRDDYDQALRLVVAVIKKLDSATVSTICS
ncbi:MAG TPA: M42 family metallopeptidase [Anaerolineae bacterium]|nr:M42 family metallopeptidase [Anaerolineae bacterium]